MQLLNFGQLCQIESENKILQKFINMTTENFNVELRKVITYSRTRKMYLNLWRAFRDGREIKDFIREQVNYNY